MQTIIQDEKPTLVQFRCPQNLLRRAKIAAINRGESLQKFCTDTLQQRLDEEERGASLADSKSTNGKTHKKVPAA